MEYYLPDELVLIGYRKQINSMQPQKKNDIWKRRSKSLIYFWFRRTERPGPNGHIVWFDADGHHRTWRWTLIADQHAAAVCCVVACAKDCRSY